MTPFIDPSALLIVTVLGSWAMLLALIGVWGAYALRDDAEVKS